MTEVVTCYSGTRFAERPIAFQFLGEQLEVAAVERSWREPGGLVFLVNTPDGRRFRLLYDQEEDNWQIQSIDVST